VGGSPSTCLEPTIVAKRTIACLCLLIFVVVALAHPLWCGAPGAIVDGAGLGPIVSPGPMPPGPIIPPEPIMGHELDIPPGVI
jgi:hypothetical protein